jgi:hypothetical protein
MLPEQLLGLGSKALRLFRVFGKLEFIRRLYDFLAHGGRNSRAQTIAVTAQAIHELEKAEALRIKNSRALLDLMKAAGFSEEKIQATLSDPREMQRVSAALTTMLRYVDRGIVSIEIETSSDRRDGTAATKKPAIPKLDSLPRRAKRKAQKPDKD